MIPHYSGTFDVELCINFHGKKLSDYVNRHRTLIHGFNKIGGKTVRSKLYSGINNKLYKMLKKEF